LQTKSSSFVLAVRQWSMLADNCSSSPESRLSESLCAGSNVKYRSVRWYGQVTRRERLEYETFFSGRRCLCHIVIENVA